MGEGRRGGRNFDAGLKFRALSWFGGQKKPETRCFLEFASRQRKGVHHKNACFFFKMLGSLQFCTLFSSICGTVIQKDGKGTGTKFGPPALLRIKGPGILVRDSNMCGGLGVEILCV